MPAGPENDLIPLPVRQADWQYWHGFYTLPLWKLVFLSLGVDPRAAEGAVDGSDAIDRLRALHRGVKNVHLLSERLEQAASWCGKRSWGVPLEYVREIEIGYRFDHREVRTADFWREAERALWQLPPASKSGQWAALEGSQSPELSPTSARPAISGGNLDQRERTSLLQIIGALASIANVSLEKPHVAAKTIAEAAAALKTKISEKTIAAHLKRVEDAMTRKDADE